MRWNTSLIPQNGAVERKSQGERGNKKKKNETLEKMIKCTCGVSAFSQNVRNAAWIRSLLSLRCQQRFGFKEMREKVQWTASKEITWLLGGSASLPDLQSYSFTCRGTFSVWQDMKTVTMQPVRSWLRATQLESVCHFDCTGRPERQSSPPWCPCRRGWHRNTASVWKCRGGLVEGCLWAERRSTLTGKRDENTQREAL